MKRLLLLALFLFGYCATLQAQPIPPPGFIPEVDFASLPTGVLPGTVRYVNNTNGSGCNNTGAQTLLCRWNGTTWVVGGSGNLTLTGGDVFGPAFVTAGRLPVFNGSSGKALSEYTLSGMVKTVAGVPTTATPNVDYVVPSALQTLLSTSLTIAPTTDAPAAIFKRNGPSQTSNIAEFQTETGATVAAVTKTGLYTGSVGSAAALAQNGTNCTGSQFAVGIDSFGNAECSPITEAQISFSDITTNNATTGRHGYAPKLSGDATQFLTGAGTWATPAGQGTVLSIIAGAGLSGGTITQSGTIGIAPAGVTNSMLGGGITASKLVGTDISGLGTITTGTWRADTILFDKGGTGQTTAPDDNILVGNGSGWQLKALPSCSNATTDKLLYNISTNTFSCGVDQAATGGGGGNIVSLNSQTGATQTFANDTNVTMVSAGNTHTLTWSGALAKARQHAATVYSDAANTWSTGLQSFAAGTILLPHASSGASGASSDVVYDTTGTQWHWYINGTDRIMVYRATSTPTSGKCAEWGANGILGVSTDPCAGSGTMGGSGTAGYLPVFSAGTTLVNSSIQDNLAGTVTIGAPCSGLCAGRGEMGAVLWAMKVAPSTPTTGASEGYVDSTFKRWNDKADDGTVGTTVVGINNPSDALVVKYIGKDGIPVRGSVTGTGDASTNTGTSVANEMPLFADTTGKLFKRSTLTGGLLRSTNGVPSIAVGDTHYQVPLTFTGGSVIRTGNNIALAGDVDPPGPNKCYGTSDLGVLGWQSGCGGGSGSSKLVVLTRTAPQTITANVATAIGFDAETKDAAGLHDTVTNNSRITADATMNLFCSAGVQAATPGNNHDFIISIRKNGTDAQSYGRSRRTFWNGETLPTMQSDGYISVIAGDYLEAIVYNGNGGNNSLQINTELNPYTFFGCSEVGGGGGATVSGGGQNQIPYVSGANLAYSAEFSFDPGLRQFFIGDGNGRGINLKAPAGLGSSPVITGPNATSTLATLALAETWTNKTLTSPVLGGLLKMPPNTLAMTGDITLTSSSLTYQNLNTNGSARNVTMDATTEVAGASVVINNIGAQTITLKNSAAATVATITTGSLASVQYDATASTWRVLGSSTTGTVTSIATTSPITGGTITSTGTIACATCVVASSPGAGVAHFAGSTQTVTSSAIVGSDMTANTVTSTQMAVVNTRRTCDMTFGNTNGSALANADLGPQKRLCFIPAAATIVEVIVSADAGTPNIIVAKNSAGSVSNILSSALATAGSGGIACSKTTGVTGIDGATTCSATLQNTSLAAGDYLEAVSGTAGGTAKLMTVHIVYTIS